MSPHSRPPSLMGRGPHPHPSPLSPVGRGAYRRGEGGQAIVIIALMLTVLIGMVALAIDGSRAYALRRDLQAAVDASALAAADKLQQTGSYVSAEQAATTIFGVNMHIYTAPSCSGYGTPGAAAWTVTCTYPDTTVLTQVARNLGPQGGRFQLSATRNMQLQFARVLTNGASPAVGAAASSGVNNLLYSPALAALKGSGCGGVFGNAITVNGSGTLNVTGDVVANGTLSVTAGSLRVAGDIYARCQSTVPGAVTLGCYPSGASTPCGFPDVAGATRSGYRLPDPGFLTPGVSGSQGFPSSNVVVQPATYSIVGTLNGSHCWFLAGGTYSFPNGLINNGDLVSNELKPPDEPVAGDNTTRSPTQFWDTDGVRCAGSAQTLQVGGPRGIPVGNWAFVLTSVRTDTYGGVTYTRESAPSMCYPQNVNNSGINVEVAVSNVPGATSYNIYASPPNAGGTCSGPFGLVASLPVSGPVQNNVTTPCPQTTGGGCSLGNESMRLDNSVLSSSFAPNPAAPPGTASAFPPAGERAPWAAGLPNQNPARASGASGDRANENSCRSAVGAYATCPSAVTPGAVELYFPAGGCMSTGNGADLHIFSGYQYNWVAVYEPPANSCTNGFGAESNSAYIGLVYAPGAAINVSSPFVFSGPSGGVIASSIGFSSLLPAIVYSSLYSPVPPAGRLVS
jgi:Flp pilus assembly protein TadG